MKKLLFILPIVLAGLGAISLHQQRSHSQLQKAAIADPGTSVRPAITQQVVQKPDGGVAIEFSIVQDNLKFNDALIVTKEEYRNLSPADIYRMQLQRFANWRTFTGQ